MRRGPAIGGFRRLPRSSHARRLPGRLASLAVALTVAVSGGVLLLLMRGPIDLHDALPTMVERANAALGDAAGQSRIEIGGARLGLGPAGAPAPGLYLEAVRIVGADGEAIAEAPTVRVAFRPLDLLAGQLRLSHVTVIGAALTLRKPPDGPLLGDLAPASPDVDALQPVAQVLAAMAAAPPPLLASLAQIAFEDTAITVELPDPGHVIPLRGVGVRFMLRDGALAAVATVPLAEGARPVTLAAALGDDGTVRLEAAMPPTRPALWPGIAADLTALDVPISGTLSATIDPEGRLDAAIARVEVGPGVVTVGDTAAALDGARAVLRLDGDGWDIDSLTVQAGPFSLNGTGRIEADISAEGLRAATAVLALGPVAVPLDPADPRSPAARFDDGFLSIRMLPTARRVEVADAHLRRGALTVGLSGWAAHHPEGWEIALGGALRDLSVADLLALWPVRVAPGAQRWMKAHLEAGQVDEAFFSVAGPLATPRAVLDFGFREARATPLPPLPPIIGGRGWGRVDNDVFMLSLAEGQVRVSAGSDSVIDLNGSRFRLEPLSDGDAPGRIALQAAGPVAAMLALIDMPPLSLLDRVAISPDAVEGAGRVSADIVVPLRRDVLLSEIGVAVTATVTEAALDTETPLGLFSAPSLSLIADTERLRLDGNGTVGQSSVAVQWDELFGPSDTEPRTTVALTLGLSPADLAALGIETAALSPEVTLRLGATVPVELRLRRDGGGIAPGATAFESRIDLRGAAFAVPMLGISKPRNTAATATVGGVVGNEGTDIDRLELDSGPLRLRARARFDAAQQLERLDIDSLRVGPDTDVAAMVVRDGRGFDATVRGRSLDATGLLTASRGDTARRSATSPPLELRLFLDTMRLTPSLLLSGARSKIRRLSDGALSVVLNGTFGAGSTLSIELEQDVGGRGTLRATSSDAGALAREANLFSRGLGGQLDLSATLAASGAIDGEARLHNVILSNDPRLDSLMMGADQAAALERLREEGIRFETVRLPFRWDDGVVTLREAVAFGPVMGITLSGTYTSATDSLAMSGVFTPLFGLNSLLGNLPLIGPLLTGGEGQGLLAFTFGLSGPASDPVVSVNPFSVLLPGALRQILQQGPERGTAMAGD